MFFFYQNMRTYVNFIDDNEPFATYNLQEGLTLQQNQQNSKLQHYINSDLAMSILAMYRNPADSFSGRSARLKELTECHL